MEVVNIIIATFIYSVSTKYVLSRYTLCS